jgi:hypothetical protein
MYVASPSRPYRGIGSAASEAKTVQTVGGVATPVITAGVATAASASIAAGGTGFILGIAPALAIPIIGAALVGITILATYLIANSGCGQTCIETSQWANQAAALLDQNIATYFAQPAPRSQSQQTAALANFDAIWARLVAMCSDPSTGDAGKRCISDREAGSCVWKQTADKVPPWGTPPAGACWNWHNGYRDPIANDPNVVADSQAVGAAASDLVTSTSAALGLSTPALIGLAALAALGIWAVAS